MFPRVHILLFLLSLSYNFYFHFLTNTNINSDKHLPRPRIQYIVVPSIHETCFGFYFQTQNMVNKRFPVLFQDHRVTHKTWFHQNFPSTFFCKILTILFWGSNNLPTTGAKYIFPLSLFLILKFATIKHVLNNLFSQEQSFLFCL